MKVYELINELSRLKAGAEVKFFVRISGAFPEVEIKIEDYSILVGITEVCK